MSGRILYEIITKYYCIPVSYTHLVAKLKQFQPWQNSWKIMKVNSPFNMGCFIHCSLNFNNSKVLENSFKLFETMVIVKNKIILLPGNKIIIFSF